MKKMFFLFVLFFVLAGTTFAVTSVAVEDSEIQEMVNLCIKNNGIENPDIIQPGFNPLWEFPDNQNFQFHDLNPFQTGESLWKNARRLLIITDDYHKNVHALEYSDPKTITATAMIIVIDSEENSNSVESSDEKNNYKTIWSITVFALFFISLTVLITRNWQDKKE